MPQSDNLSPPTYRSSNFLNEILGDTTRYRKILNAYSAKLVSRYPDPELVKIFNSLSRRTVTLLPMAFFDSLSTDFGYRANNEVLLGIGLSCVVVATHDDVVDEMPKNRKDVAKLIYGGDITNLLGIKTLLDSGNVAVVQVLLEVLSDQHYLQRLVVDKLWNGKEITDKGYFEAVKQWCTFCSIGPMCALAFAGKNHLSGRISRFALGYGVAFQLTDDLLEMGEDKISGYMSLPLQEGYPFKNTFKQIRYHLKISKQALFGWQRTSSLVNNLENFIAALERELINKPR